jgi:hypothetical protein
MTYKVKLNLSKDRRNGIAFWSECLPFVENNLAVLIHRPTQVTTYYLGLKYGPHIAIHYWCGNTVTGREDKLTFLSKPPRGRLVCARCEEMAINAGEYSSDKIVGRHVHVGRVKALQTCCGGGRK